MAADTSRYDELLSQARQLEPEDQLRLLEDVAVLLRQQMGSARLHSIVELKGLGKDIWQGIDAQEYVDQERSSWDG